jgi:hypothetical protein
MNKSQDIMTAKISERYETINQKNYQPIKSNIDHFNLTEMQGACILY